jgi:FKBP-type peptidyl-prolyl cis-trans isomerase
MRTLIPFLACVCLSGCSLNFTRPIDVEHQTVELESGVLYEDEQTGVGEPAVMGDELEVHYGAWLEDGQQVDSSVDRGIPIRFVLGEAPIAGWNEALVGMSAGGRRRLTVPPDLAYGEAGIPGLVPPNASLSFEIDLLAINPEEQPAPE